MNFQHLNWLPAIIGAIVFFTFITKKYEKNYFYWIKKYFFYERTFKSKLASLFYITGFSLLFISLLDLRGPEQQHKSQIPDQKTIVIIDSSASMLAEDIRPNRFQKSVLLARHFIKNAVGHQIAVVLFSDTQKQLVPFTDDIDLLDSRVSGLADNDLLKGGSNISQAIKESVQYFKMESGKERDLAGNVLVFTDSEEHEAGLELEIPDGVNLAIVGVGTARGGPIPLRSNKGVFYGYKKHKGENVVTKLDENFIKKLGDGAKNFKYWITTSFSIPTEEIVDFFRSIHKSKLSDGLVRVRPVYSHYILYLAILFLGLANLLSNLKTFSTACVLLTFIVGVNDGVEAQEAPQANPDEEKKELPLDEETSEMLRRLGSGNLSKKNKLKLGERLALHNHDDRAIVLYEENLNPKDYSSAPRAASNYGTVYLKKGAPLEGALVYSELLFSDSLSEAEKSVLRQNLLIAFEKQKQNQKNKKNKKNKENKDKNKKNSGDQSEDQKSGKSPEQGKQKKNEQKDQEKNKKKDKGEEEKQKKEKDEQGQEEKERPKSLEEKEEELRKKRKMVKIPAMLKQIMDTDRQLQNKYLDTSTKDKTENRLRKDW